MMSRNERVSSHHDNSPLLKINPISRSSAPPSTEVQDSSGAIHHSLKFWSEIALDISFRWETHLVAGKTFRFPGVSLTHPGTQESSYVLVSWWWWRSSLIKTSLSLDYRQCQCFSPDVENRPSMSNMSPVTNWLDYLSCHKTEPGNSSYLTK